jgi:hypothetical protein
LISIACASRLGASQATLYSYGFFAAVLLVGATATPAATVLAGPLVRAWDGSPRLLDAHLVGVARLATVLVAVPMLVTAVLGPDLLAALPAGVLTSSAAEDITAVVLALSGLVLATAAGAVPTIACNARGRYAGLATVSVVSLCTHALLSVWVLRLDDLVPLALVGSVTAVLTLVGHVLLVYGSDSSEVLGRVLAAVARVGVLALVAFTPALLAPVLLQGALHVELLLAVLGCVVYPLLVKRWLPDTWAVARRLTGRAVVQSSTS